MADDQATLGSFAEDESDGTGDGADDEAAGTLDTAPEPGARDANGSAERAAEGMDDPVDGSGADLVCPWCLAPDDRFVEGGPTALACGRCSAALPVDADWFRAREVVARRPMYEAGD